MAPVPPVFESVAGTYVGLYRTGYGDEVRFNATFVLELNQSRGNLVGTWSLDGTETWGAYTTQISLAGTIIGELGAGPDPSIGITIATCGARERFSGMVRSGVRLIQLTGRVNFADPNCDISFTTPAATFVLRPQE